MTHLRRPVDKLDGQPGHSRSWFVPGAVLPVDSGRIAVWPAVGHTGRPRPGTVLRRRFAV